MGMKRWQIEARNRYSKNFRIDNRLQVASGDGG
jgi:hypothetical protein